MNLSKPYKHATKQGIGPKLLTFFICFITALPTMAQEDVEMASSLRDSGKIYVVVATVVLIFIGMVIYLIKLDRKISKIENEENPSNQEQ